MRSALVIFHVVLSSLMLAQDKGQVRLFIDPGHQFEFVLDGKYRMQERDLELSTGPHQIVFWAPARAMVDTTLNVQPGQQAFYLRLPYSKEYLMHERRMGDFKRKVFMQRSIPVLVTGGVGVWAAIAFVKYKNANDDLQASEEAYHLEVVPNEISRIKSEIRDNKDALSSARTNFYFASGAFAVAAAGTIYQFIRTKSLEPPVFEDQEKVRFDGLVWLPDQIGGGVRASVTIPIR